MVDITGWHPALQALVRVLLFVLPVLMLVPGLIWWERRLLSWMQDRIGPNRVGPFGLLQPIADGIKLFTKEDITPTMADKLIYFTAPAVALFPAFALGGTLPWSANTVLTPISDANIGVLYIMAISSLGVYGVSAGYGSNNKYSLMGGLRSSAQLISYELAMGMALASIVLATGSLRMTDMVAEQMKPIWGTSVSAIHNWFIFTPYGFIAAVVFGVCMLAETNRAPFDLPEAENELIAGYHTEYSSMKFAVFFMGEYAAMLVFSGVFATLFLGGYDILPFEALKSVSMSTLGGFAAFAGKTVAIFTFFIWTRGSLPRLRYDQLMSIGWRSLLPTAVANFIIAALWIMVTTKYGVASGWIAWVGAFILLLAFYFSVKKASLLKVGDSLAKRTVDMVEESPRRPLKMVDSATEVTQSN